MRKYPFTLAVAIVISMLLFSFAFSKVVTWKENQPVPAESLQAIAQESQCMADWVKLMEITKTVATNKMVATNRRFCATPQGLIFMADMLLIAQTHKKKREEVFGPSEK